VTRFVDKGAIFASWVGLGMAVTVVVSFVLVIPIEFLVGPAALLGGMLIGYYANARSERIGGPWRRVIANALLAGVVTGLTYAVLLLGVKAIFFSADNGYRDASSGGPLTCRTGADCVYQRYLAIGRGPEFEAAGINNVEDFTRFYWGEQLNTSGTMVVLSVVGALAGGLMYGAANRRRPETAGAAPEAPSSAT
jgi:hypothetical protein